MANERAAEAYSLLVEAYLLFQEWKGFISRNEGSSVTNRELIYAFDIWRKPGQPIGTYAKQVYVTPGTYTAVCRSLVRKQIVEISYDSSDKRVKLASLTGLGRRVVEANLHYFHRLMMNIQGRLGEPTTKSFFDVLAVGKQIMEEGRKRLMSGEMSLEKPKNP